MFTQRYREWVIVMDCSDLQIIFNYGYFICSLVERSTIRPSAHTVYLCIWCGF